MKSEQNARPAAWRSRTAFAMTLFLCAVHPSGAQFTAAGVVSTTSVTTSPVSSCSTALGSGTFGVSSWNWGEQNSTSLSSATGGLSAGKVSMNTLTVTKSFDTCSAQIAQAAASGQHLASVTLKQFDKNSNLLITVLIETVVVSSYQIGGSQGSTAPTETVSYGFSKITITSPSNTRFCWDNTQNKTC